MGLMLKTVKKIIHIDIVLLLFNEKERIENVKEIRCIRNFLENEYIQNT